MLFPFFSAVPQRLELNDSFSVARSGHSFFCCDEGIQFQQSQFVAVHVDHKTSFFHFLKIADSENRAQAIELADICV